MDRTREKRIIPGISKLPFWAVLFLILLPILTAVVCLCIGRVALSPADVLRTIGQAISGTADKQSVAYVTVLNVRLPRILLGITVGAGLSVAGCVFQSLFANPLATPDTVGVASGASFGAALGILLGGSMIAIQSMSFLMGILAVSLTWLLGKGKGKSLNSVVLAGIMIGSLFSALVSLTKFAADSETQLPAITYFLMGSLSSANYPNLLFGAIPIVLSIVVFYLLRWRLNLLPYSEDEVRSFGVSMSKMRIVSLLFATLVCSSSVSMCGQVGWIGLLVPHMCRMKLKNNHAVLIPACVSVGASFMVIVDTLARSVSQAEIPVSILTAVVGAPFFIYLMKRSGGWKL